MKYVQIGILACLASITVLLGAIYWEQRPPEVVDTAAVEVAPPLPDSTPTPSIIDVPEPKPRPVRAEVLYIPPAKRPSPVPVEPLEPAPSVEPVPPVEIAAPTSVISLVPPDPIAEPIPEIPEPRTVTLPAGLTLTVRLDHTLSTERNQAGDDFQTTLDEPIIIDGLVIAEKGAQVEGRVVRADRAGRVKGRAFLALELTMLATQDGQLIPIETRITDQEGPSSKKKDAAQVGLAAGIGAAIGAVIGGGKGAAIGAATGAGAGAGTVAATRGEPLVLHPETRLRFQLNLPVTVTEQLLH
jgi:hypothetical protein